jgi:very-short-patch-repair endonuclease
MALLKPYPIRETVGLVRFAASQSPIRHAWAGNLPWQRFSGYKFRRQPTLGDYYLDFLLRGGGAEH